jgi:hypothetical protein
MWYVQDAILGGSRLLLVALQNPPFEVVQQVLTFDYELLCIEHANFQVMVDAIRLGF